MKKIQGIITDECDYLNYVQAYSDIKKTLKGCLTITSFSKRINAGKSVTINDKTKELCSVTFKSNLHEENLPVL
jgi:hypothetical protein